jgi:hypothetical protein
MFPFLLVIIIRLDHRQAGQDKNDSAKIGDEVPGWIVIIRSLSPNKTVGLFPRQSGIFFFIGYIAFLNRYKRSSASFIKIKRRVG